MIITIRERAADENAKHFDKYVVVTERGNVCMAFGVVAVGGDTREEALAAAERWVSKNYGTLELGPEWDGIEAAW